MYALNLNEEKRILSACVVLPNGNYEGMPIVDRLPDESDLPEGVVVDHFDITDFLYKDGKYVYSPLSKPEPVEPEPTGETVSTDDMAAAIKEGVNEV